MSHQTVAEYACGLVRSAEIRLHPFPHIVVDGIFPEQYYEELLSHLPAVSSLTIPVAFGMMKIGEDDATFQSMPERARQFWIEFDQKVKPSICGALLERYLPYAAEKLSLIFGEEADHLKSQLERKSCGCQKRWALEYFCDLTPLYGTATRQYPSDFDNYACGRGGVRL